jgi:hypothetical protein
LDTSAIISLLADEPTRLGLLAILDADPEVIAWWGISVEIASALADPDDGRRYVKGQGKRPGMPSV